MQQQKILLAADFDGTLAEIRPNPGEVSMDPEVRTFLSSVASLPGVALAFLSGRDLRDLEARTAGIPAYRCGSHGLDVSAPSGALMRSAPPLTISPPASWIEAAESLGLMIEFKRHGIAVHWRAVQGLREDHPVVRAFQDWAASARLFTIHGRSVVEARIPGPTKKETLIELSALTQAQHVIFAGDDLTDFPALEWASRNGTAFFVASEERDARPSGALVVRSARELLAGIREAMR